MVNKPQYLPSVNSEDLNLKLYKNTWVRSDFNIDKKMVNESIKNYDKFSFDENSIVLDLGANIGGFTKIATSQRINKYIGVEPDPSNIAVAKKNAENAKCEVIWLEGAASINDVEDITFFQSVSDNAKCSGTVNTKSNIAKFKNGISYLVKNYNIYSLLEKYKPTHLKIDIEGAEIDWLLDSKGIFPDYIQQISIEVHGGKGVTAYSECFDTVNKNFEHLHIIPITAFKNGNIKEFPKLGITYSGTLFGIDIFMNRK